MTTFYDNFTEENSKCHLCICVNLLPAGLLKLLVMEPGESLWRRIDKIENPNLNKVTCIILGKTFSSIRQTFFDPDRPLLIFHS